jgi:GT2 family glycosyltransferase
MVEKLAIVIPTHNRSHKLSELLNSLDKLNLNIDTYIVSNYFSKDDQEVSSHFNFTHYLFTNELGVNKARNLGAKEAIKEHDYVLFLDDDCFIDNINFFEEIDHFISKNSFIKVFGGEYKDHLNCSRLDSFYNLLCSEWVRYARIGSNHWTLLGGCLVIHSSVFQENNFFDERISYGSSETEFLSRLNQVGYKMAFSSRLIAIHKPDISFKKFIKKAFKQGYFSSKYKILSYPKRFTILGENNLKKNNFMFHIFRKLYNFFFRLGMMKRAILK